MNGRLPIIKNNVLYKTLFLVVLLMMISVLSRAQNTDGCTRRVPEPVIRKKAFPEASFQLKPDSLTAIEKVKFNNGDRLIINHKGCEYYVLSFRFESSYYQHNPADIPFWFNIAAIFLDTIAPALNTPINIKKKIPTVKRLCPKPSITGLRQRNRGWRRCHTGFHHG